jgi:hypothetical protein
MVNWPFMNGSSIMGNNCSTKCIIFKLVSLKSNIEVSGTILITLPLLHSLFCHIFPREQIWQQNNGLDKVF